MKIWIPLNCFLFADIGAPMTGVSGPPSQQAAASSTQTITKLKATVQKLRMAKQRADLKIAKLQANKPVLPTVSCKNLIYHVYQLPLQMDMIVMLNCIHGRRVGDTLDSASFLVRRRREVLPKF